MDNEQFDILTYGAKKLENAVALVMSGEKVVGYRDAPATDEKPRRLIFYWADESGADYHPFPTVLDAVAVTDICRRWLESLERDEIPGEIDMDGSCIPDAFRVYTEEWGRVDNSGRAVFAIHGHHRWCGK